MGDEPRSRPLLAVVAESDDMDTRRVIEEVARVVDDQGERIAALELFELDQRLTRLEEEAKRGNQLVEDFRVVLAEQKEALDRLCIKVESHESNMVQGLTDRIERWDNERLKTDRRVMLAATIAVLATLFAVGIGVKIAGGPDVTGDVRGIVHDVTGQNK